MKTLVIFYSYTGDTKAIAQQLAEKDSLDIVEIQDIDRPGSIKAYTVGCYYAMLGRSWPIHPLSVDLETYDHYILLAPVWAGRIPPAMSAVLENLPEGKTADVKMVSASGKSSCQERLETIFKEKGGSLESFEDINSKTQK